MKHVAIAIACVMLSAGVALASWYDDYEAGLKAIQTGQWKAAAQRMSAAIAAHPKEGNNERTYGAIFITYHPYYYRAVAEINLGEYQKAVNDLEQTSGPGAIDRGSIDTLMKQAKAGLETPAPVINDTPKPVITTTTQAPPPPAGPTIDPALRMRARTALDNAKAHLQTAQQRNATTAPSYQQAQSQYMEANNRLATAKSNEDLNLVIAAADNITLLADGAQAPIIASNPSGPAGPTGPKIQGAGDEALKDLNTRLHRALENYFNGDFDIAEQQFRALTKELPRNGWIWAFLGASQYSQYAFEGEDSYKASAMDSFRKARTYGKWKNGLPDKYFSRRIRNAYKQIAG